MWHFVDPQECHVLIEWPHVLFEVMDCFVDVKVKFSNYPQANSQPNPWFLFDEQKKYFLCSEKSGFDFFKALFMLKLI